MLTVEEDNNARKINVMIGQGIGRWVSISGALKAGESVIVRGGERLQQGQKVRFDESLIAKNN